eukprot:6340692-Amphidinium_carterae.1
MQEVARTADRLQSETKSLSNVLGDIERRVIDLERQYGIEKPVARGKWGHSQSRKRCILGFTVQIGELSEEPSRGQPPVLGKDLFVQDALKHDQGTVNSAVRVWTYVLLTFHFVPGKQEQALSKPLLDKGASKARVVQAAWEFENAVFNQLPQKYPEDVCAARIQHVDLLKAN